jgi:elongator complex protein 6
MASRIPPLLEPYLSLPPEASLILLTSVLGASTNWLVLRHLYSALQPELDASSASETKVVLVSFLRDLAFWRDGARKLVCLNEASRLELALWQNAKLTTTC